MNTSTSIKTSLLGFSVAVLLATSPALRSAVINGVDFATVYSGTALPASPWVYNSNIGPGGLEATVTANSPSPGILTLDTSAVYNATTPGGLYAYYQITNTAVWNGGTATGSTIELSMKVDSIQDNPAVFLALSIYFSRGTTVGGANQTDYRIHFTPTSIVFGNASVVEGKVVGTSGTYDFDTTLDFNTYRLVLEGGSLSLYINNSQTPALSGYGGTQGVPSNTIYFGDGGNSTAAKVEYEYFAFTNAGAFAPVPEPAAMGLVLGGLALLSVRTIKRIRSRR